MVSYEMSSDVSLNSESSGLRPTKKQTRRMLLLGLLLAGVFIGIGVIIGWFSRTTSTCEGPCLGSGVPHKIIQDGEEWVTERIIKTFNKENVKHFLEKYTAYPHMAGSEGEDKIGEDMMKTWEDQGLDHVKKVTYDVLLSYPDKNDPNLVFLLDHENNKTIHTTQREEFILSPDQNHTDVVPPFNAFSPPGDPEGELVYVNYGRVEDFQELTLNYSIDVTGKLVIARYGRIFRGDKVANAHSFGAIGVILYSDPADYSVDEDASVYPDSWWLPGTGVQRGSIDVGSQGDPLTPGYPATATAYRRSEESSSLPDIPCHPIGYDDAIVFLQRLRGDPVPDHWKGKLNITYKFGPGFEGEAANWTVKMHVTTTNKRANSSDVFGYIRGSVEPDRYVLLGNHRDAWVFGAIDPTSGTALMMEVSRVLGLLVREGWRPRRTIVFCSWGAEEHGLMGSYEWVEGSVKNLMARAVAYINVDLSVEGSASMRALGLPVLYEFLYTVAKKIPAANNPAITLYDEWLDTFPSASNPNKPDIYALGSGSDYAAFIGVAGIPCIDVRYTHNYDIIDYPVYHSVYETFHLFNELLDPEYKYSEAIGRYWAEAARYLADSLVLPLDANQYSKSLVGYIESLNAKYGQLMKDNNVTLDGLEQAAARFVTSATDFTERAKSANKNNPLEIRQINDQLMSLERAFTDPEGIPYRPLHKHVLYAPSKFDSYAGDTFPGLIDLMWQIEDRVGEDKINQWELVKEHLAALTHAVNSATSVLKPVTEFD